VFYKSQLNNRRCLASLRTLDDEPKKTTRGYTYRGYNVAHAHIWFLRMLEMSMVQNLKLKMAITFDVGINRRWNFEIITLALALTLYIPLKGISFHWER